MLTQKLNHCDTYHRKGAQLLLKNDFSGNRGVKDTERTKSCRIKHKNYEEEGTHLTQAEQVIFLLQPPIEIFLFLHTTEKNHVSVIIYHLLFGKHNASEYTKYFAFILEGAQHARHRKLERQQQWFLTMVHWPDYISTQFKLIR